MIALSKNWKKKAASERVPNASYRLLMHAPICAVFFGFLLGSDLADNTLIAARALAREGALPVSSGRKSPILGGLGKNGKIRA